MTLNDISRVELEEIRAKKEKFRKNFAPLFTPEGQKLRNQIIFENKKVPENWIDILTEYDVEKRQQLVDSINNYVMNFEPVFEPLERTRFQQKMSRFQLKRNKVGEFNDLENPTFVTNLFQCIESDNDNLISVEKTYKEIYKTTQLGCSAAQDVSISAIDYIKASKLAGNRELLGNQIEKIENYG